MDRERDGQRERRTERETDREKDRQREIQTERKRDRSVCKGVSIEEAHFHSWKRLVDDFLCSGNKPGGLGLDMVSIETLDLDNLKK